MRLIGDVVYVNKIRLRRDKKNTFVHIPEKKTMDAWMTININGTTSDGRDDNEKRVRL